MSNGKKALIAMSGGVDSSVALHLMQSLGFECVGATMKLYDAKSVVDGQQEDSACGSESATEDAAAVAAHFGIAFHVLSFCDEFRRHVINNFVETYQRGDTPNPCIECNRYLKFGRLIDVMESYGCEVLVTGHYARIERNEETGRYLLKKGKDATKDQSYVLYRMTQKELANTMFPLGEYTKAQIREVASEIGLSNAEKKDSQDICFIPDGDYASFVENYTGQTFPEGNFVTKDGKILGRHKGIIRYTIGQRKGLGLALPAPMYVCEKRMDTNEVVLCSNEELFTDTLYATDLNWIAFETLPPEGIHCTAKARYKQKEAAAFVIPAGDGCVKVVFEEPQRGITAGQSVVFYEEDIVLGGGRIM